MSWSVSVVGRPGPVAAKLQNEFTNGYKCAEPEETVRQAAGAVIVAAVNAQDPNSVVRVSASGHQQPAYDSGAKESGKFLNTLTITIEPVYGFVE